MDRPNIELTAAVEAALAIPIRQYSVACLLELRMPDAVIARLLCDRDDPEQRRQDTMLAD